MHGSIGNTTPSGQVSIMFLTLHHVVRIKCVISFYLRDSMQTRTQPLNLFHEHRNLRTTRNPQSCISVSHFTRL